ncbi:MAG: hypothetical protein IPJ87_08965 [Flavobacteriales bacterium]|jgi:hypothetical protein|nr:hypothetical protein [Flavobacteriales bacterium]MBK7941992.1 hypothetical protein [Flavobacteriales bacterium]MBK9700537.1 hypothetical protein [Flavobacteriales bacterium]
MRATFKIIGLLVGLLAGLGNAPLHWCEAFEAAAIASSADNTGKSGEESNQEGGKSSAEEDNEDPKWSAGDGNIALRSAAGALCSHQHGGTRDGFARIGLRPPSGS